MAGFEWFKLDFDDKSTYPELIKEVLVKLKVSNNPIKHVSLILVHHIHYDESEEFLFHNQNNDYLFLCDVSHWSYIPEVE